MLRSYPKALGDAQIPVRNLLECSDIQEAIDRSIEEKVHQLSFAGLSGIADFMEKQFGVLLDKKAEYFVTVAEVIEVRHLIVHHGGKVSRRFLAHTSRNDLKPGTPFPIGWKWVVHAMDALRTLADEWDEQVFQRLPTGQSDPSGEREAEFAPPASGDQLQRHRAALDRGA